MELTVEKTVVVDDNGPRQRRDLVIRDVTDDVIEAVVGVVASLTTITDSSFLEDDDTANLMRSKLDL